MKKSPFPIPTGFPALDAALDGGMRPGLIVISSRPGVGKTSLGISLALNVALHPTRPRSVHIVSLEMSRYHVMAHLTAAHARVRLADLRPGKMSMTELQQRADDLFQAPLFIQDRPISVADIGELARDLPGALRRVVGIPGLGMVLIDYAELIHGTFPAKASQTAPARTNLGIALQHLARQLDVPIVVLSQMRRRRARTERPRLGDVDPSLALYAEVVGVLRYTPEASAPGNTVDAELVLVKNRLGPTDAGVRLRFLRDSAVFENPVSR